MTQGEVAAQAGTIGNYVSRIETGTRRAEAHLTPRLAAALGVPAEILTGQLPAVRYIREHLGITVADLAYDTGLPVGLVKRIEAGSELASPAALLLIANRLGVDPEALRAYVHQHETPAGQ